MQRRQFLTSVSTLALVGACAGSTLTVTQAFTDLQSLVPAELTALGQVAPGIIPQATQQTVTTDLNAAAAAAQNLSPILSAADQASGVTQFFTSFNAALAVLAGPPVNGLIPAPLNEAIAAADILLPPIEALFTSSTSTASVSLAGAAAADKARTVRANARASAPQIKTADDARAVLAKYRKH